jgi:hypothetical protein
MIKDKYDVVGDIHGHAEVLRRLLRKMGYRDEKLLLLLGQIAPESTRRIRDLGQAGGRGGIRTHGTLAGTPVFKTGALNRSATLPSLRHQSLSVLKIKNGLAADGLGP